MELPVRAAGGRSESPVAALGRLYVPGRLHWQWCGVKASNGLVSVGSTLPQRLCALVPVPVPGGVTPSRVGAALAAQPLPDSEGLLAFRAGVGSGPSPRLALGR